jgi:hypothetical protein
VLEECFERFELTALQVIQRLPVVGVGQQIGTAGRARHANVVIPDFEPSHQGLRVAPQRQHRELTARAAGGGVTLAASHLQSLINLEL